MALTIHDENEAIDKETIAKNEFYNWIIRSLSNTYLFGMIEKEWLKPLMDVSVLEIQERYKKYLYDWDDLPF